MNTDHVCRLSELVHESTCRDCGGVIVHVGGCELCLTCGLSRCEG